MNETRTIAAQFALAGDVTAIEVIVAGHINDTYSVSTNQAQTYVLQRINHQVFRDPCGLMRNVSLVTSHIRCKLNSGTDVDISRRVLQVVPTKGGELLHETASGEFWRMYPFIERTHPVPTDATLDEVYQAGVGFGQFAAQLVDLPASSLVETIPKFHHGPSRDETFKAAAESNAVGRAKNCRQEIDTVHGFESLLTGPQEQIDSGELPLRVTHNDTKCNNILLDDTTNEAMCVIDLDTVMPGLLMWDFGDLVRTSACRVSEDETNLALVRAEPARFEAAAKGYLAGVGDLIAGEELESLAMGPTYMALIMATRFLTDYLAGDTYYKVDHERHNLDRCRNQLALVAELEAQRPRLEMIFSKS